MKMLGRFYYWTYAEYGIPSDIIRYSLQKGFNKNGITRV